MPTASPLTPSFTSSEAKLAKSCARCRQHKFACKSGPKSRYPCSKCDSAGAQCILVERARPTPTPTIADRVSKQEVITVQLQEALESMRKDIASLFGLLRKEGSSAAGLTPMLQDGHHVTNGADGSSQAVHQTTTGNAAIVPFADYLDDAMSGQHVLEEDEGDVTTSKSVADARKYRDLVKDGWHPPTHGQRVSLSTVDPVAQQAAFDCFTSQNLPALCFLDPKEAFKTPKEAADLSELLFWSIMAVGSREREDLHDLHVSALRETTHLLNRSVSGEGIDFWFLCGAMVYNRYLAAITPIGHLVDLAYSLDLDRAYSTMQQRGYETADDAMKIRLWVSILGQDIFHSGVCNRPPHYPHTAYALQQARWLAACSHSLPNDRRLLATYEFENIIHSVVIGLNPGEPMVRSSDDWRRMTQEKYGEIDEWRQRWEPIARDQSYPTEMSSMLSTVKVNSTLAKFTVSSRPLRGVKAASDIDQSRKHFILESVQWARTLCRLCASDFAAPAIQYVGETTLFAFAWCANFIMKVSTSLHTMPDMPTVLNELEAVIANLKHVRHSNYAELLQTSLDYVRFCFALNNDFSPNTALTSPIDTTLRSTQLNTDNQISRGNGDDMLAAGRSLAELQSFLSDPPSWDPSMTWWLPMAQGRGDWPWDSTG